MTTAAPGRRRRRRRRRRSGGGGGGARSRRSRCAPRAAAPHPHLGALLRVAAVGHPRAVEEGDGGAGHLQPRQRRVERVGGVVGRLQIVERPLRNFAGAEPLHAENIASSSSSGGRAGASRSARSRGSACRRASTPSRTTRAAVHSLSWPPPGPPCRHLRPEPGALLVAAALARRATPRPTAARPPRGGLGVVARRAQRRRVGVGDPRVTRWPHGCSRGGARVAPLEVGRVAVRPHPVAERGCAPPSKAVGVALLPRRRRRVVVVRVAALRLHRPARRVPADDLRADGAGPPARAARERARRCCRRARRHGGERRDAVRHDGQSAPPPLFAFADSKGARKSHAFAAATRQIWCSSDRLVRSVGISAAARGTAAGRGATAARTSRAAARRRRCRRRARSSGRSSLCRYRRRSSRRSVGGLRHFEQSAANRNCGIEPTGCPGCFCQTRLV